MNKFSKLNHLTPYETDYAQWSVEQARLLREGRLDLLDRDNLAEEIEDLGKKEKREIESRLVQLLLHLLKWQLQPEKRKGGWEASIRVHRTDLREILSENPSLRNYPNDRLTRAYTKARLAAEKETGIAYEAFPDDCPYTVEQVFDDAFLPDGA